MTPPSVVDPPKLKFHAVWKEPHACAGMHVERGRECGCGRWFPQWVVAKRWLDALSEGKRAAFLESCEVEKYPKGEAAWHPKRCHRCERRALESRASFS